MATTAYLDPTNVFGTPLPKVWRGRLRRSLFGDIAIIAFLLAQFLDGLFTYIGVNTFGLTVEANPLIAGLMVSVGHGAPHAKFGVEGRLVPLWSVEGARDRAVYAGEAAGRWLWVIVHPAEASAIVVQPLTLVDARLLGAELTVVPVGELSPRLVVE